MADNIYVMSTSANQVFSAFSFIGFVLAVIPLPWHLQSWNTGTCLYMLWASLSCLNYFINSVVWNNHVINVAPGWCEISIRIIIASNIGIPAASLCISRRLYHISALRSAKITDNDKRRGIMEDLAIGLGLPLLGIPFAYITQAHRFDIFEQAGCMPAVFNSAFAVVFISLPPVIIGLVSGVYCVLTIRSFNARRAMFRDRINSQNISSNRYFRLMALAFTDLICTVPIATYFLAEGVKAGISPWISWADTHSNWGEVDLIPALVWRTDPAGRFNLEFSRWLAVVCAFVFFGFFGFAEEARKNYWSVYSSVSKRVGYSTGSMSSTGATSTSVSQNATSSFGKGLISFGGKTNTPVIVRQETTRTVDGDTLSSYQEKHSVRISTSSVFDDIKDRDYPSTPSPS